MTFHSQASNLVTGDTNGQWDVFVHDRQLRKTVRVSVSSAGGQGNNTSGESGASVSGNGRYVVFGSYASNLVSGDTNGGSDVFIRDRDTDGDAIFDEAGAVATTRVSVSSGGSQGNRESRVSGTSSLSPDGRYVIFYSGSTNLVTGDTNATDDVFRRDRGTP